MSKFYDDIARGCLPTGEPLECLYGVGWWTEEDEPEPEPDPEPDPAELKPCPFCGWEFAEHAWNEFGEEYRVCDQCGASSGTVDSKWDWQSRPIEDELRKRIAKLEALVDKLIEAGEVMKQACGDQWGWEDMFDESEFTDFDDLATGWKEREG